MFLGDSITQAGDRPGGYVALVRDAIREKHPDLEIEIIGAGIGGNRVPDLEARLERDVLSAGVRLLGHAIRVRTTEVSDASAGPSFADRTGTWTGLT